MEQHCDPVSILAILKCMITLSVVWKKSWYLGFSNHQLYLSKLGNVKPFPNKVSIYFVSFSCWEIGSLSFYISQMNNTLDPNNLNFILENEYEFFFKYLIAFIISQLAFYMIYLFIISFSPLGFKYIMYASYRMLSKSAMNYIQLGTVPIWLNLAPGSHSVVLAYLLATRL